MPTSTAQNKPASSKAGPETTKTGPVTTKIGMVESDKRSKSRTVVVRFKSMHAKYGKYVSRKTVLQVHDEHNESKAGDRVEVKQCRPVSRTKRWTLVRVVERAAAKIEHV